VIRAATRNVAQLTGGHRRGYYTACYDLETRP